MSTSTNTKPSWQSKTLWFNAVGIVLIALQFSVSYEGFEFNAEVQALVLAIINILLRFRTSQPITIR